MATKKPAPKKAAAKVAAKKPIAKPAAKKAVAKPVAKRAAPKPAPKKAVSKVVAKKPVAKPAVKAVAKKPIAKPVAKKIASKPVTKKAASKVVAKKSVAKPAPKAVIKKAVIKKEVIKEKKVKAPKPLKVKAEKPIKVKAEKPVKVKAEKPEKVKKERKGRAKKPKRIIRVPKPAKIVKAAGIEKATTVIPIKKIVPKIKEEPIKNFKVPKITTKTSVSYSPDYVPMDKRKEESEPQLPLIRYSDTELNEFRDLISKKLAAAKKELAFLHGVITRKDDMGGDNEDGRYMTMEDGSLSMEREQMSNMASRQITFIDHLEKAIQRIESKTYGICRVTGKLIDKARLRAVPHATLSLEAKLGLVKAGE